MSRIGKLPIDIPDGVDVQIEPGNVRRVLGRVQVTQLPLEQRARPSEVVPLADLHGRAA